jgi:replicative DNA helicase
MTDHLTDDFDRLVTEAAEPDKPDPRAIEETLLVGLFTSPQATAKILADTRPADFHFDRHRRFARLVYLDLTEEKHIDAITLGAKLPADDDPKGRADLLAFAAQVFERAQTAPPTLGQVEAYLAIFVEATRRRLALTLAKGVVKGLEEGELSPDGGFAQVFEVFADLEASRRLVGAFKSEGDDWASYLAALEAAQTKADYRGLNSGFDHLNNVANGLIEGLFVLGAAPSTGKTTFAKQLTDQVAALNPDAACLFVSFEQSREELRVKTLSRLSGVENRDILRGRLDVTATGWKRVKEAAEVYRESAAGRVFILEGDKATTVDRVRLAGLQVKRATGAGRLFIALDYLQVIPTEEEYRDPRNRVDAVVSDLRRLARDLGAAVIAVSSVGRASYEHPSIKAFKESGGIEYAADLAALMTSPRDKAGKITDKGTETVEGVKRDWVKVCLDIVKNRNGERARVPLRFFPQISRFIEDPGGALALPDEEPDGE